MTDCKDPTIVTNSDANVNTITTIGELKHLVSCMSESSIHLSMYAAKHVAQTKHKAVIKAKISLIIRSLDCVAEKKSNTSLYNKGLLALVTVLNHGNDQPKT